MARDFFHTYRDDGRPWLILGMGPTFSRRGEFDLSGYNILGINRIVSKMKVKLCQIIDFYIAEKYQQDILDNAEYLVMPYHPHFAYRAHPDVTISKLIDTFDFMKKLDTEG